MRTSETVTGNTVTGNYLALFPGRSHLQLSIACSMQKTEGEDLGERVTCVMSGTREGRHEGVVPDKKS